MTLLAFAAVAAIMLGQQAAPLVSQTELPPPAVQQQAPPASARPEAVQDAPQGVSAQQQPPGQTPVTPIKPSDRRDTAGKNETKGSGAKRVVAFWVILPDRTK